MTLFDAAAYQRVLTLSGVPKAQAHAHGRALETVMRETRAHVIANDAEADEVIVLRLGALTHAISDWMAREMANRNEMRRLMWFNLGAVLVLIVLVAIMIWLIV